MTGRRWDLLVAGSARRALGRLPDKVAVAVLDFLVGPLLDNPHRVGKPLRGTLEGLHSARIGPYRVVYEIDEETVSVAVVFIDHRADVYRPR